MQKGAHKVMIKGPFTRSNNNPLITPGGLPIPANGVLNPGVAELDGEVILLLRIEDRRGVSQIRVARSANGVDGWEIDSKPLIEPGLSDLPYEEWGCEDARVTRVGPRTWLVAYVAYSRYGPAVAIATTEDFRTLDRKGVVLAPTNKDAAVFPRKFNDQWVMLHRPVTGGQEHIWYAYADLDFAHWGSPGVLLAQHGGPWWDGLRVGVGAPPILTDQGWLLIYHGVKEMGQRPVYRLGLALLDLDDPRRVLRRSRDWAFAPETSYEQQGLVPGVVFTCGSVQRGDETWMYYGAADTVVGLAVAKTSDLLEFVEEHDYLHEAGRAREMRP
jgi:beta-1,4-mannooligosaccharide/beta-1,4-mannosyl-N-acetylglucosamine phosphorylase